MSGLPIKLRPMSDQANWGHEFFAFKPDIDEFEHVAVTTSKNGALLLSVHDIYHHPNRWVGYMTVREYVSAFDAAAPFNGEWDVTWDEPDQDHER